MILELQVEQIAVIESARLSLGRGFTVLTGETGAGKSLLIDAISLALGDRADTDLVRAGASTGVVAAEFDLTSRPDALEACAAAGIAVENGRLIIVREVSVEGRSSCRANGRLVPVSVVKQLGRLLVDLHGQHDHQALLNPDEHRRTLDLCIGEPAIEARAAVAAAYEKHRVARERLRALQQGAREREQRLDLLRFQVNELNEAQIRVGERAELEQLSRRLANAQTLKEACQAAREELALMEGSAQERLATALAALAPSAAQDEELKGIIETLQPALYAIEEGAAALREFDENLEVSADALEETLARLETLKRLMRKYGDTEEAMLAHLNTADEELALLENSEESAQAMEAEVAGTAQELEIACTALTAIRKREAPAFAQKVQAELHELAMEKARFEVEISPATPEPHGADAVTFNFSANPGEPPRALHRIASGGELSRVMLALKVVLAGRAGVPTLIFDEIDAGLSGRAAAVVARKLEQIAGHYQVLAISHLPQLAGRAAQHYRIEKVARDDRTYTQVRLLSADDRVTEVARMLAGEEIGESALANARELLASGSS